MSTAFTSSQGSDLSTLARELRLAYYERVLVRGGSIPADPLPAGTDIQAAAFWSTLQSAIEGFGVLWYVDHSGDPIAPGGDFNYYTVATLRASAGLHADGFKRSTDGVTFHYGHMQPGDAIGSWIIDELQAAFSVLRWSTYPFDVAADAYDKSAIATGSGCDTVRAAQIASWASASWSASGFTPLCLANYRLSHGVLGASTVFGSRRKATYSTTGIPAYRPCARDIYFYSTKSTASYAFADIDSLGLQENKYALYESLAESSDGSLTYTLGDWGNPIEVMPGTCPTPGDADNTGTYKIDNICPLLKWNFTNSN